MLLLLAHSQVGRVWRLVSNDREVFRQGSYVSVLKDSQRVDAIGSITAQVILLSWFVHRIPNTYYVFSILVWCGLKLTWGMFVFRCPRLLFRALRTSYATLWGRQRIDLLVLTTWSRSCFMVKMGCSMYVLFYQTLHSSWRLLISEVVPAGIPNLGVRLWEP